MARYLPSIARGFVVTIELALAVIATGLAVGLALAMLRSAQIRVLNWAVVLFVDLGRALPPLAIIVVVYFALPHVGVRLSGFMSTWSP